MTSEGDHLIAVSTERKQYAKGAGLFDSGENLAHKLQEDWDTVAVSVGAVAVGLDFLSFVVNPLGELVKAGVGWLMENLAFLREPLDLLAGDPDQIKMIAQTWNNIADELATAADTYDGALSTVAGWGGDSAINYRALAVGYTEALRGTAEQARSAAQGVTTAGIVVGTTRAILFDIIATFISNVITRALLAMASSWCTFGASVAVFVTSVIADVVKIMAKIQKHLGKLLGALQRFVKNYSVLGDGSAKAAKALGRKSSELGREANQAVKQANKTR